MNYEDFLKTVTDCQFCNLDSDFIIERKNEAFLTHALAPYSRHHLLIIPNRHIYNFEDLKNKEKKDIDNLLISSIKSLKLLGHENYTILLRNGENIGKSVKHLHYHIIPSSPLEFKNGGIERNIMTEEEIFELMKEFKDLDSDPEL